MTQESSRLLHIAKLLLLLSLITIVGLSIAGDYGVASDERVDAISVYWNVRAAQDGATIPISRRYYGTVFPLASEAVYQAQHFMRHGSFSDDFSDAESFADTEDTEDAGGSLSRSAFRARIAVKHPFTFLFSLIAYAAVAGMVAILAGLRYAWLGPLFLALTPRFWGHSFFNPKDVPFAALFTLAILAGAYLVRRLLEEDKSRLLNRTTLYALAFGALTGLVTGTRLAGFLLIPFVALTHLLLALLLRKPIQSVTRHWSRYLLIVVTWFSTVTLLHPASWSSPLTWLLEAFARLSQHPWQGFNLFRGFHVAAQDMPWYYLPFWFLMTTPAVTLILFAMGTGLLLILLWRRRLSPLQLACVILVILQIGFLPAFAILRSSTVYDGLRQFLFILPGIATVAATGVALILQRIRRPAAKTTALLLLLAAFAVIGWDMFRLHPYEYVYFNRPFGGLESAEGRFDTDYWGLSMREAMAWLNTNRDPQASIIAGRPYYSAETFADPGVELMHINEYVEGRNVPRPFYVIALNRFEPFYREILTDCDTAHVVSRAGVALTTVLYCQ